MQIRKPHDAEYVPISMERFLTINYAAMMREKANWEIVDEAIEDWARKNTPERCVDPGYSGYQWKQLFLPHGTVLRTAFKGKQHHCLVEGDRIMYQGQAYSPSAFVAAVGGIRRNAWKSIWLLLPDARHWQLADAMRVRPGPADRPRSMPRAKPRQPDPAPSSVPPAPVPLSRPRARQAAPAFAGWVRKYKRGQPFMGCPHKLVALLRQGLRQDHASVLSAASISARDRSGANCEMK